MRRVIVVVLAVVAVAFGLWQMRSGFMEMFPGLAADADVKAGAEKAQKAAADFVAVGKDAYRSGKPPRQSDAAAGPLLDAVFDVNVVTSKPALSGADAGPLGDWSLAASQVGLVYILAGTGVSDISQVTNDPKLVAQANANIAAYAPELGRYMDAELVLQGALADTLDAGTGSGMDKIRTGVATSVGGMISTLATDGLTDDWRRQRIATLVSVSPKLAKLLSPPQCKALRDNAHAVGAAMHDATVQSGLESFGTALKC